MIDFTRNSFAATAVALSALMLAAPTALAQQRDFQAYYPAAGGVFYEQDVVARPGQRLARYEIAPDDADADEPMNRFETPRPSGRSLTAEPRRNHSGLDLEVDRQDHTATLVRDPTGERPGAIVVDTAARKLYLVHPNGEAIEYGIGVGRLGFTWKGTATIGRKAEWPSWTPPTAMLKRRPDLPTFMEGGLDNPLGARALYLYTGGRDTLFRIHGTNEPDTIGQAVSSGCIRMMNADVMDLYSRVKTGTRVIVR